MNLVAGETGETEHKKSPIQVIGDKKTWYIHEQYISFPVIQQQHNSG
jgi:hypothetical protein